MYFENFNSNDYVVISNCSKIKNCKKVSYEQFLEEASTGDLIIDGDMYCHIPEFDQDIYESVKEQAPEAKWFVLDRSDIPSWFKADEAIIVEDPEDEEEEEPQVQEAPKRRRFFERNKEDRSERKTSYREENNDYNNDSEEYENNDNDNLDENMSAVKSLFENSQEESVESGNKEAKIYVFGSSKGGSGKTFTCLISAYRYAKLHPGERIAVADFDIIDGQVGISIQKITPTMMGFWKSFISGDSSFKTMHSFSTKSENFPSNIDFYLTPKDYYINDKKFWLTIISNLVKNYDTVFFDTGIDYINYPPISYVYKVADRIILTSTTSIKSVSSVLKQISRLSGVTSSANANGDNVFKPEDNIKPKLRLAITGYNSSDSSNKIVIDTFNKNIKINAVFGQYSSDISEAEYYGHWYIFDNNTKFNKSLDKLVDMDE